MTCQCIWDQIPETCFKLRGRLPVWENILVALFLYMLVTGINVLCVWQAENTRQCCFHEARQVLGQRICPLKDLGIRYCNIIVIILHVGFGYCHILIICKSDWISFPSWGPQWKPQNHTWSLKVAIWDSKACIFRGSFWRFAFWLNSAPHFNQNSLPFQIAWHGWIMANSVSKSHLSQFLLGLFCWCVW